MRRILLQPNRLEALSSDCRRAAGDLRTAFDRIGADLGGLDTSAIRQLGVGDEWNRANGMLQRLVGEAEALANRLRTAAQRFEQADYDSASEVSRTFESFRVAAARLPGAAEFGGGLPAVPQALNQRVASLGGGSAAGIGAAELVTPVAGLAALVGVTGMAAPRLKGVWASDWDRTAPAATRNRANKAMATGAPSISLEATEAAFLASLLGAHTLLGLSDPLAGMLAEEIREAWQQAKANLLQRGYVTEQAGGQIVVDGEVALLMGAWGHPEAVITVTYAAGNGPAETRNYFATGRLSVEQTTGAGEQELGPVHAKLIADRAAEVLRLTGLGTEPDQLHDAAVTQVRVPESVYARASAAAQKGAAEAAEILREGAGSRDEGAHSPSEKLAGAMASATGRGAVTAMSRQVTTWEVSGLGMLAGAGTLWRLRAFTRGNQNWVEATISDAVTIRREIGRIVNRVMPEPGSF